MNGLVPRIALLTVLLFAAAALAAHGFFAPALSKAARDRILEVAGECIEEGRGILEARSLASVEKTRRELLDLPFELIAGDPAAVRSLLGERLADLGSTSARNVEILMREFTARAAALTDRRAAELSRSFRREALVALLALFAAVLLLLGAALARTVLAPLGRLLRATERVAGGDLDVAVGMSSRDEVGRLGRAFDRMAARLRESRAEIEALNAGLAGKVRERTAELRERNEELTRAVAELRATRDALVHSETMASVGTLAGGVAHEFNNLLGGIIGCAENVAGETDPAAVREAVDMILRTARRACGITGNLLDFSRPPAREPRTTDLSKLAADALALVAPEARGRTIELRHEDTPAGPVSVDPGQIHQVVLNLLTNALRATPPGGRITVTTGRGDDGVFVRVADTGRGIDPEHLSRIFEPFFTTGGTGGGKGTGLGLSVSWSIVRAHGGRIDVESRPGKGAVFTVRLPAETKEAR
jgi:two-component system NtrC family sensor kinase